MAPPCPRYHLYLGFDDGSCLTVSVQGWGAAMLLRPDELEQVPWLKPKGPSPLSDDFTLDYFLGYSIPSRPMTTRAAVLPHPSPVCGAWATATPRTSSSGPASTPSSGRGHERGRAAGAL